MKTNIRIAFVFALVALLGISAFAQKEWVGSYSFDENGGKTAGGTGIFISHEMEISEGDDALVVIITANGYQTSRDLLCTAKVEGGKLKVYFQEYGENNIFETFEKGDLLLTLERGKKNELLTTWGKYEPAIDSNAKPGKVYFRKEK